MPKKKVTFKPKQTKGDLSDTVRKTTQNQEMKEFSYNESAFHSDESGLESDESELQPRIDEDLELSSSEGEEGEQMKRRSTQMRM